MAWNCRNPSGLSVFYVSVPAWSFADANKNAKLHKKCLLQKHFSSKCFSDLTKTSKTLFKLLLCIGVLKKIQTTLFKLLLCVDVLKKNTNNTFQVGRTEWLFLRSKLLKPIIHFFLFYRKNIYLKRKNKKNIIPFLFFS